MDLEDLGDEVYELLSDRGHEGRASFDREFRSGRVQHNHLLAGPYHLPAENVFLLRACWQLGDRDYTVVYDNMGRNVFADIWIRGS